MNELAVIDQAEIDKALVKVESLNELISAPTTKDNAQLKKDASLELAKISKLLDSKRADAVKPALEEQRRINSIFKPVMEKLEEMSKGFIKQVSEFVKAEEKKEAEFRALQAKAEAEKLIKGEIVSHVDEAYGKDQTSFQQPLPKVSETKVWVYDIIDESQVPRDFMAPNPVAIQNAIKAGKRQIAGLRIYEKTIVGRR